MAGHLTFLGLAEKILSEEKRPLSPAEIWKIAVNKGYDSKVDTESKKPIQTLYAAIFTNTRDHPDTVFYKLGDRPARYFLKELKDTLKPAQVEKAVRAADESAEPESTYTELELHPFLAYYARVYFKAFAKTIRHSSSTKKEFGEWVHPDMVGVYFPIEDWKPEVLDLSAATGNTAMKLYSFELKKSLSFANLREAFFQAVSNSSWANEGYLVAAEVSKDEDFLSELRRLSGAFGIGIIRLSLDDPDASEIFFPAKEREAVDWDTLNKLTMNADIKHLLVRIKNDLQTKEIIKEQYDKIHGLDELLKLIKKKSIKG